MTALQTLYTLSVTARTTSGSEVKLQRTTQTVGIPVFQFGVFSSTDLSFFPVRTSVSAAAHKPMGTFSLLPVAH